LRFLALALTLTVALFVIAFASAESLVFGFGPADHEYVEGFRVGWARGTTARWSRERASVELPVRLRGDVDLVLVGGRPQRAPLEITFRQEGAELDTAMVGERSVPYAFSLAPGRAAFAWESASSDEGHGLRIESLTLRPKTFGAILPDPASIARAAVSALLFFLALARAGFSARASAAMTLAGFAAPLSLLAHAAPFASLHWLSKGALLAAAATCIAALARRKWETLVLAFSLFSGSLALFHPAYYFQDVDIHRNVSEVVRAEGAKELWSRMDFYQQKHGLGRASVEGTRRPMPYPPVLHTLAGWFPLGATEDVLKWLGILASTLTVALVMAAVRALGRADEAAASAGALAALFPESALELLRASYPALLGHLVDVLIVYLLLRRASALSTLRGVLGFGAAFGVAALVYNATPLNLAAFLPLAVVALALPPAVASWRGLLAASALGSLPALLYYGPFLLGLLRADDVASGPELSERIAAVSLGWDAFGPLYLVVALAGLVLLARRSWARPEGRLTLAWAAFVVPISLVVLAAPEPLYYFRRLMFVYPLGPILAVYALSGRRWLLAAGSAALAAWSVAALAAFVEPFYVTHTGSLAGVARHDDEGAPHGKPQPRESGVGFDR
jgi:hypothetical protein